MALLDQEYDGKNEQNTGPQLGGLLDSQSQTSSTNIGNWGGWDTLGRTATTAIGSRFGVDPRVSRAAYAGASAYGRTGNTSAALGAMGRVGIGAGLAAIGRNTGLPAAQLASLAYGVAQDIQAGTPATTAVMDRMSSLGLSVGLAMLGSLLGPIGTIAASLIGTGMIGSHPVSQGFIGDMLDTRSQESFRDAYEDMTLSATERSDLDRMANSEVNPGSQLAQLERTMDIDVDAEGRSESEAMGTNQGGFGGLGIGNPGSYGGGEEGQGSEGEEGRGEGDHDSEEGGRGGV